MKDLALKKSIETVVQRAFPSLTIRELSVKEGSNNGDNYMGVMHAIDIQLENKSGVVEQKHLILKASPINEARKEFAENMQVFDKEAAFYRDVIPELLKFQEKNFGGRLIEPAFVKCYDTLSSFEINNRKCDGTESCIHCQPALPWHYILMQDIRAEGGFRMGNRFSGLDFNHCELVVTELAKYHALSYAYMKSLNCKTELFKKFPFLKESMITAENGSLVKEMFLTGSESAMKILAKTFSVDSFEYKKLKELIEGAFDIYAHFVAGSSDLELNEMLSNPVDLANINTTVSRDRRERNQWLVMAHGDCWVNNFLFKYSNDKPVAVKLVDLQIVREICLTTDLAYFLYMSTTPDLRRKHLNQLLGIYYDTFKSSCNSLNVEPWADFTLDNLKKKYRKTMLMGASVGLSFLPLVLLPKEAACDLEKEVKDSNIFGSVNLGVKNENLENRILATAKECLSHCLFQ